MIAQLDGEYVWRRPLRALARVVSWGAFEGRPVTTRGRWVNPLVFAWLTAARRLPVAGSENPPVYVVGTGRSGTTVLGKILSLHRDVGFLNEPKAVWHEIHPGEDVIGNYTRGPARYRLGEEEVTPERAAALRRLYGIYARAVGARTVLDKYPELIFRVPFVRGLVPDARFVFLVRDGWDVVRSIDRWSHRFGVHGGDGTIRDWWGVDDRKWRLLVRDVVADAPRLGEHAGEVMGIDRHVDRAAVEWAVTMLEGTCWLQRLGEDFRLVRYERLVEDPSAVVPELMEYCGVERDPGVVDYACEILRPSEHKPPADLHPLVEPFFREMMERMGYRS